MRLNDEINDIQVYVFQLHSYTVINHICETYYCATLSIFHWDRQNVNISWRYIIHVITKFTLVVLRVFKRQFFHKSLTFYVAPFKYIGQIDAQGKCIYHQIHNSK